MAQQTKANILLVMVTMFWGLSYLFMKMGLDSLEPLHLIAFRFGIGFIASSILFHQRLLKINGSTIKYAFILGLILFISFIFITYGVKLTTASNAGFLISLTVLFVPLITWFYSKVKPTKRTMRGLIFTLIGTGLLTLNHQLQINFGDLLCIFGALGNAIFILVNGKFTKHVDSLALGICLLGFTSAFGFLFAPFFEAPQWPVSTSSWVSVLGLGLLCSAFGFIGQTVAQKYTTSTAAGLIFSLEPVFAAFFAFVFLGDILSPKGFFGAGLILTGTLIAEFNFNKLWQTKKWRLHIRVHKH
ncbi:EamA family transporter [Terrilactibacillus sp. BCM23-1]|uniref:EamA family transporter n=1 Tax=Terrilactibacillus tamarindi TaxID=2599694 RepID=A0A6N8CVD7_9BACI|nr:DMT family transporter [Terrilactibacillus tamarindi]MTT33195.1 EamA family transporter [Terrilactibacillus tamarindi]